MTALMEVSITNCFSSLKPINSFSLSTPKFVSLPQRKFKLRAYGYKWSFFFEVGKGKDWIFMKEGKNKKKVFNQGFGFDGGGNSERVIGILVLAIGFTYLTLSGQLSWVLDAIVSFWCPNCENEFQVFKSTLNEESQLCPYCSAPFPVEDGKFVRDPVKFSKESSPFGQTFNDFPSSFKKGKDSNITVVDVEAEIRDAD